MLVQNSKIKKELLKIGWREWISLPNQNVKYIKAKIDTGARTSSLHVTSIKIKKLGSKKYVHFTIHPIQRDSKTTVQGKAVLVDYRHIRSSSGHVTVRPVVNMKMKIGEYEWVSEVTLVNRDMMGFRMLLGREALRKRFLVDTGRSFLLGKKLKKKSKTR